MVAAPRAAHRPHRNACTVIRKPFSCREITGWLDAVARPLDDTATAG